MVWKTQNIWKQLLQRASCLVYYHIPIRYMRTLDITAILSQKFALKTELVHGKCCCCPFYLAYSPKDCSFRSPKV